MDQGLSTSPISNAADLLYVHYKGNIPGSQLKNMKFWLLSVSFFLALLLYTLYLFLHCGEQNSIFGLVATNALPQCLHTFMLEFSSVSIKENIICTNSNKELKSQTGVEAVGILPEVQQFLMFSIVHLSVKPLLNLL